jgi:hypothetical protein
MRPPLAIFNEFLFVTHALALAYAHAASPAPPKP